MILKKNIDRFAISENLSIKGALKKLDETAMQILFVTDNKRHLKGVVTDGDIRRWLLSSEKPNLNYSVKKAINKKYISAFMDQSFEKISELLNHKIKAVPITNKEGVLVAAALKENEKIIIGNKVISENDPTFIIAEIGNNHQGDIKIARELVDRSLDAGADCVKFQLRTMKSLYKNNGNFKDISADLGSQYTLNLLSKYQLEDEELFKMFDYCHKKNIIPLCTPWDLESLEKLDKYGMLAYKIASADLTNYGLLEAAASKNAPLICSTGMSKETEIYETNEFIKKKGVETIFLHCNSTYPTPYKDVNLNYLSELKKITKGIVGYSGHERGYFVPIAAVSMGARVIEKHVTLNKLQEGNDHKVSLLPDEFKEMVLNIRGIEESLGSKKPRNLSQGELLNREMLAKSLVSKKTINQGDVITRKMITVKSPGQGIQPNRMNELVGKKANRCIKKDDFFFESDLKPFERAKDKFSFDRPFGIPVRYHDFKKLSQKVNLDFVEFHLSYQDLKEDPRKFIKKNKLNYSVHCPELFEGDHILDLCSPNAKYRKDSIFHLKSVLSHIKKIDKCFIRDHETPPIFIINVGGWNEDGFLNKKEKEERYNLLKDSLSQIDLSFVNLAIQTMPPFPWHFGGQSFHNLFVSYNEIDKFCRESGFGICLDVSHSMMACNYYGWKLNDFIKKIGKYVNYLHIVDAIGADGEGIQIGQGDVDFDSLGKLLSQECKNVPFIPEIWQGHKDSGAAFWSALEFLEPFMRKSS